MATEQARAVSRGTLLHSWTSGWLRVDTERVELPGGHETELAVVRHPGAACVLPFLGDDEVLLIRQYRHATGGTLLEAPAGKLDPGELPEACAARELIEETGYRADRIEHLSSIWTTPGFSDEVIHLYAAFDLTHVGQRLEPDEVIELAPMSLDAALAQVFSGELRDAKTALALLLVARKLGRTP
jgi:ADP-ribose pyrophosphatase